MFNTDIILVFKYIKLICFALLKLEFLDDQQNDILDLTKESPKR